MYEASLFFILLASAILTRNCSVLSFFYFFKIRETYIFISYVKELSGDFRRRWIQALK